MAVQVKGFGEGVGQKDLKAGDFFVGKSNGVSHLSFVTDNVDETGDPLVVVLRSTAGDQDANVPYGWELAEYARSLVRIDDQLVITPPDGASPFNPPMDEPSLAPGLLCVGEADVTMTISMPRNTVAWVSLVSGHFSPQAPSRPTYYDKWTIRWRDGDREETLAAFGTRPRMTVDPHAAGQIRRG